MKSQGKAFTTIQYNNAMIQSITDNKFLKIIQVKTSKDKPQIHNSKKFLLLKPPSFLMNNYRYSLAINFLFSITNKSPSLLQNRE